ncbi:MAG: hypothetical protein EB079_03975 [Verrucomicrobia bacterium]|nr:hypothetical protein [Verrucomicrobiota bacterium]
MEYKKKLKDLKQIRSQIKLLESQKQKLSEEVFDDFIKTIFNDSEELESFGWYQYTPYFDDGNVCMFSANTDYLLVNGQPVDESDWYLEENITTWGVWDNSIKSYVGQIKEKNIKYNKNLSKLVDNISDFLSKFDNDFFLQRFGDHAIVTITKTGVQISDYDHD